MTQRWLAFPISKTQGVGLELLDYLYKFIVHWWWEKLKVI